MHNNWVPLYTVQYSTEQFRESYFFSFRKSSLLRCCLLELEEPCHVQNESLALHCVGITPFGSGDNAVDVK